MVFLCAGTVLHLNSCLCKLDIRQWEDLGAFHADVVADRPALVVVSAGRRDVSEADLRHTLPSAFHHYCVIHRAFSSQQLLHTHTHTTVTSCALELRGISRTTVCVLSNTIWFNNTLYRWCFKLSLSWIHFPSQDLKKKKKKKFPLQWPLYSFIAVWISLTHQICSTVCYIFDRYTVWPTSIQSQPFLTVLLQKQDSLTHSPLFQLNKYYLLMLQLNNKQQCCSWLIYTIQQFRPE